MSDEEILPPAPSHPSPKSGKTDQAGSTYNTLRVEQFNYYGNDLRELRKISETDPELAKTLVATSDKQNQRFHTSERFGVIATVTLLIIAMISVVTLVLNAGLIELSIVIGVIVAIALLLRVILTGEWSETSWIGSMLKSAAKLLGAKDDNPTERPSDD